MNKHVVIFILIIVLGIAGMLGYYFINPKMIEKTNTSITDAKDIKGQIRIGVDNWIGYYVLCSKEMQRRVRNLNYRLKCIDDKADYKGRMQALSRGELDFAVATVDSFILNGASENFPGVIVMVIDESKGGDALVARKTRFKNIEDLKSQRGFKVAFTPASPSEHLLKSVAVHFDVAQFSDKNKEWRLETNGSAEALDLLMGGKADVAVLWEPDVSRALANKDIVKILGTENTQKLIVDVLLVGRDFLISHPAMIHEFLGAYFRVLKTYRDDPERFANEVRQETGLSQDQVVAMLKGVKLMSLHENASVWFGIKNQDGLGYDGLVDAMEAAVQILQKAGDFADNPLPDADPYRLQNRSFIQKLYEHGLPGETGFQGTQETETATDESLERKFKPLTLSEWEALHEIGTLKIRPVTFQSGTELLDMNGKIELDMAAANLKHYPHFRVVIKGHTGLKGDTEANMSLSLDRAEAVKRYLMITYNIDENRFRALGRGALEPLDRLPGESDRAYNYRLPRVALHLVSEVY
ncbi:MAG: OmpA family protein [Deltaproteobacteria bacterium]|nr:OmpA family protein [Deltaproteobacteria bacterium]